MKIKFLIILFILFIVCCCHSVYNAKCDIVDGVDGGTIFVAGEKQEIFFENPENRKWFEDIIQCISTQTEYQTIAFLMTVNDGTCDWIEKVEDWPELVINIETCTKSKGLCPDCDDACESGENVCKFLEDPENREWMHDAFKKVSDLFFDKTSKWYAEQQACWKYQLFGVIIYKGNYYIAKIFSMLGFISWVGAMFLLILGMSTTGIKIYQKLKPIANTETNDVIEPKEANDLINDVNSLNLLGKSKGFSDNNDEKDEEKDDKKEK